MVNRRGEDSRSTSENFLCVSNSNEQQVNRENKDYSAFTHPSVLMANMIKSGLYPQKERKRGNCCLFTRLVIGLVLVSVPSLILLYFIFNEPLRFSNNAYTTSDQVRKADQSSLDSYDVAVYVNTNVGLVRGTRVFSLDREINSFLGVPFAEPPIGKLRFAKTRQLKTRKKLILATKQPLPCLQHDINHRVHVAPWISNTLSSEDCLYLNIWSPATALNASKPVMVWLHGGAFISGSIDVPYYNGAFLSSYGDVVIVTINYRLGVFGFMNVKTDAAPGNMGLHDQVVALKWIKENIAGFGGNPNLVTLFGESAGAFSVGFHLFSPLSRNLFKRAILQSGSPFYPQILEDQNLSLKRAQSFAERAGCANSNLTVDSKPNVVIACLQRLDAHFLSKVADEMIEGFHPPFGVTIGDEFLPDNPYHAMQDNNFGAQKEILIGVNKDEGSFFLHWTFPEIFDIWEPKNVSDLEAEKLIEIAFKSVPDPGPKLISHFFMSNLSNSYQTELRKVMYDVLGDFIVVCPSVFFSEQMGDRNVSVHYYVFSHRPKNSKWSPWMGVTHFDEVPFVFGTPFTQFMDYTNDERSLSARIMDTWTAFANYGKVPLQSNKKWPLYSSESKLYMNFDTNTASIESGPHEHNCNLWKFMFQTIATV